MAGPSSREPQITIAASSMFPGFRFSPTDEELISYYLKKKINGCEDNVEVISEVEICRHEPWDLPAKSSIRSENEWFFFSARGRKYPNGTQSRRATELGYWKATGKERNVKAGSRVIGTKRTLVFHLGRAPKGERTEWIMHEYCMDGTSQDSPVICRLRRNTEFQTNDGSNQATPSQKELSSVDNRNHVMSEGGIDGTILSEAVEGFARRCPSSDDSHSVEQMDSASESNQNLPNEVTMMESSICQKDTGDEEDFFADILKDDLIKLDDSADSTVPPALPVESRQLEAERRSQELIEASLSQVLNFPTEPSRRINPRVPEQSIASALEGLDTGDEEDFFADILKDDIIKLDDSADSMVPPALPMEFRQLEAERRSQELIEASLSQVLNFLTEPSRRINPRVLEQSIASALEGLELKGEHSASKGKRPSNEQPPTCLLTTIVAGKTFGRQFSSVVLAIAILAGLLVFLLGGYPRVKTIAQDFAFYVNFWK